MHLVTFQANIRVLLLKPIIHGNHFNFCLQLAQVQFFWDFSQNNISIKLILLLNHFLLFFKKAWPDAYKQVRALIQ